MSARMETGLWKMRRRGLSNERMNHQGQTKVFVFGPGLGTKSSFGLVNFMFTERAPGNIGQDIQDRVRA